ncbi:trypsin-like serine peptidase [Streptomyces jumonjinensis]|uniref:Trypsin-like serine protease n=1 Tax=Streptomyces jumonjinensis TaxID=1945 RepID=A0A646KSG0_STRJU|nr:hypothetical protein [Streptomyces jumonjinensis]MQT05269.1 hypothetical protein [Streptomyces jumonjinensis]
MRRIRRALLSSAAALLALGAGVTTPAQAGSGAQGPGPDTVTATARLADGTTAGTPAAATALERYWTPERMAEATPAEPPAHSVRAAMTPGPAGTPGSTPPVPPARGALLESPGVGKVFYTSPSDNKDYFCSAAALASPSKQLVITAGHCVNDGGTAGKPGAYVRNWVYIPAFRSGTRPYGTFQAKEFRAFTGWVNNSDLQVDIAMVTTHPLNGKKLTDVTGGNGLSWNYDHQQTVTAFGYSADHNNSQIQRSCQSTASPVGAPDNRVQIKCAFRGGGGPWLRNHAGSGLGFVNGVVSTLIADGWNRSSYFGDGVKTMWDLQGART